MKTFPGSLFTYQFFSVWNDTQLLGTDNHATRPVDFFENTRAAIQATRQHAIENPEDRATWRDGKGAVRWGISAAEGPYDLYSAYGAPTAAHPLNTGDRSSARTLQAEGPEAAGDGQPTPRGNAEGATTVRLDAGEVRSFTFPTFASGRYFVRARYSNDNFGTLETVEVRIDGALAGSFLAQDTGDFGQGWNNFLQSGDIGPIELGPGVHQLTVTVTAGDGGGIELDSVTAAFLRPLEDGTATVYGAGSSVVHAPDESIAALWEARQLGLLHPRFGFADAFNADVADARIGFLDTTDRDDFPRDSGPWANFTGFAIDHGPMLILIDNYLNGQFVPHLFMSHPGIHAALSELFTVPPSVTLSLAGSPPAEAGGVATVTATLSDVSGQDVTVTLGFAGTAVHPADYTRSGTVITIPAGQLSGSIVLTGVLDILDEPDETVVVEITAVTNGFESGSQDVTAVIADAPIPSVALTLSGSPLAEAGGVATVTATLSAIWGQAVTVTLGFAGTAALTSDYTRSGTSITIPAGSLSGSVTLTGVLDILDEPDETVVVEITAVTNGVEQGVQQVTATIRDGNEPPPPPAITINDVRIVEGNSGTRNAIFTVRLSAGVNVPVTVRYVTTGGTARPGNDFAAVTVPRLLRFNPGQTARTIVVPIVGDTRVEPDEMFFVRLSRPTNATIRDSVGAGTILNDDSRLTIDDVRVLEGNAGTRNAVFTVRLSSRAGFPVTVQYVTAGGTARPGSDFVGVTVPRTVRFNPGQTARTIAIPIVGDRRVERDETFSVRLAGSTNATIRDGVGVGTIRNDDRPGGGSSPTAPILARRASRSSRADPAPRRTAGSPFGARLLSDPRLFRRPPFGESR